MKISTNNRLSKPPWLTKSPNLKLPPLDLEPKTKPKIIAAIPAYNEERFIGSVVLKTKKYVDEVIVIDDGSTDATAEIAMAAGAEVVKHLRNQGKGAALETAFRMARKIKAETLVLLDGDAQHNGAQIPLILKSVLQGESDVVVGSRFLGAENHIPRYRTLGQYILTLFTNVGSRTKITDSQSGFRAFSRRAINIMNFRENGLSVESEMQFLINEKNLKVVEVPIDTKYEDKAKRSPVAHGLGVLNRILKLASERRPLLIFGVSGTTMFLVGIAIGIITLNIFVNTGGLAMGHALLSFLLCILGALAVFMGIILNSMKICLSKMQTSLLDSLDGKDREK